MTIALHQKTNFPLTGSHLAVACIDCHKPIAQGGTVAYHFANLSCVTCHEDPHKNQFADRMARTTASGKPLGCVACHSTKTWSDITAFNHANTTFQLTGTHKSVSCSGCHRPPNMETNLKHVSFRAAPSACEECHENPHGPQFMRSAVTRCAECHNTTKWRPSLVDHEKTAFSLKGAHQNVRCGACHTNVKEFEGKPILFYKPTPTACSSCHGSTFTGAMHSATRERAG
jgi:hypothetical protein